MTIHPSYLFHCIYYMTVCKYGFLVLLNEIERLKPLGFVAAVKCRVIILSNLTVTP